MPKIIGKFVEPAVAAKIAELGLTNTSLTIEADKTLKRKAFSSFYINNIGSVERTGTYADADLDFLAITTADVATISSAVNTNFPSVEDVNAYVQTIKDPEDAEMPFANIALIEYRVDAADEEPTAIFIKRYENLYLVSRKSDIFPAVVADVTALGDILEPTDGLKVQVASHLPDVVIYTFNSTAVTGIPATDATPGNWNAGIDNQYSFANVIGVATVGATDGTAADAVDGSKLTNWITSAANPEFTITFPEPTKLAQYSFERVSTTDFTDAGLGDPGKWTLQAVDTDGVWVILDSREIVVHKDVGPMTFRLPRQTAEYTDFKFVFENANPIQITEIGVAEAVSNDQTDIVTLNESDLA